MEYVSSPLMILPNHPYLHLSALLAVSPLFQNNWQRTLILLESLEELRLSHWDRFLHFNQVIIYHCSISLIEVHTNAEVS